MSTIASVTTGLTVLAAEQPEGPEFGKSSPLGLLIIVLLLVGTALLIWSMNSQLRKLPKSFDGEHPEPDQAFDEGTDSGALDEAGTADDTGSGTDGVSSSGAESSNGR